MPYTIEFAPAANRQFRALSKEIQARLATGIDRLIENPRESGVRKLKGVGIDLYRKTVGEYRVIFKIDDKLRIVLVVKIGHRKEIYRRLQF